jgi:alpha-2-macroglobulin
VKPHPKRSSKMVVAATLTLALLVGACTQKPKPSSVSQPSSSVPATSAGSSTTPATTSGGTGTGNKDNPGDSGKAVPRLFDVKLSPGVSPDEVVQVLAVTKGDELDPAKIAELTAKLPGWNDPATLATPFKFPTQSSPPPRTGATISESFPPAQKGETPLVDNGPLKVLRVQPDGDVPIAPYFTVTFNQPMVPVGTVSQVAAATVPVTVEPKIAGRWNWIGARTLRFDADDADVDRLPMATEFTVTIPAGTKSAAGGTLADASSFTFTTPAPKVELFTPQNTTSMGLGPVFVVLFDQRVDPNAVLKTTVLRAGSTEIGVRPATQAEIDADEGAAATVKSAKPGRFVAFRAVSTLPKGTPILVTVGPGTPSAEGPIVTTSAEAFNNSTYGPLKIERVSCEYGEECPPGTSVFVAFTNQLVPTPTDAAKVTIEPKLAGQKITVDAGGIKIVGSTQAKTTYTIGIPGSLADVYGQTLGADESRKITIGESRPWLRPLDVITTLDPFSKTPNLSVLTTNHKELRVRVFAADPAKFAEYLQYAYRRDQPNIALPSWKLLSESTVQPKGSSGATLETQIDLSKELGGKAGQVIALVEAIPSPKPGTEEYYENRPILSWVQSTTIGVDAFTDDEEMQVWATDLRTGAPLPELAVTSFAGQPDVGQVKTVASSTTSSTGLVKLSLPAGDVTSFVQATRSGETAVLSVQATRQSPSDSLRWYAIDDRQIYKPGETMKIKGWVRQVPAKTDDLILVNAKTVNYVVTDANGNELTKGNAPLGSLSGFDLSIDIPLTANTGPAYMQLGVDGGGVDFGHSFQIAEFRRPEFEVKVQPISPAPFLSTKPVTVETQASYLAGGALPGAPVEWSVSTSETTFSPAGWDTYTFGIFRPWWFSEDFNPYGRGGFRGEFDGGFGGFGTPSTPPKRYKATTDATGKNVLQLDFTGKDGVLPDLPVSVSVAGTVTDVNRQAWSDQNAILVHAADLYVGLRSDRAFVREGDPLKIEAVVTDLDGKAASGSKLRITAGLVETNYKNGEWVDEIVNPQTCDVESAAAAVKCEFNTPVGGQYKISTTVTDGRGGRNRTELTVWVSGAGAKPARGVAQEKLTVVPDKQEYAAGDTAKVLVAAPFQGGEGLAYVLHNGIRDTKRFTLEKGSTVIEVPITEADIPGISVTIETVGATARLADDGKAVPGAPLRPAYAVGTLSLSVPPKSRTLAVTATPAVTQLAPGESTKIAVNVKDATGAPVADAEFAAIVVDEAVLGLTEYQLLDPIATFYSGGYGGLQGTYGRDQVQLLDPETLLPPASEPQRALADGEVASETTAAAAAPLAEFSADKAAPKPAARFKQKSGGSDQQAPNVDVRTNFDALALFKPSVRTDANGNATVEVTVPDNLTRYRIMVVATSGTSRFGTAESNLTARLPLGVRPSAPRFANVGDEFELPVVIQNNNDTAATVNVVLQTANLDTPNGNPVGRRVSVPANDRVEVRFPVKVRAAGNASFRVTAFGATASDSVEISLPIFTPGTAEAFATYGVIDAGAVRQPLLAPTDVIPSFGGLEISTSSTSLQSLTDALLYVDEYDYKSSDAYSSRIMSISALRGVLKDFGAAGLPTEKELNAAVDRDVLGLVSLQNPDGGFRYWSNAAKSEPFTSVQATHALVLAKQAGYAIRQGSIENALQFVSNIDSFLSQETWGAHERDTIKAYSLWVRALAGQRDPAKAAALFRQPEAPLTLDALAWLWGSLDAPADKPSVERSITNAAVDTAGAVSFAGGYDDSEYLILQSDRRTDAIVLESLIANASKSDLIPKVVTGLLSDRVKGRWSNIQENTFALLAFKRYYDTYESVAPNFVASAWLGQQFAGEHTFAGRSTDRSVINVPMAQLVEGGNRDLVLSKNGAGRMYYRVGLRYVPANLKLDAIDRGFVVQRTYEAIDNKADVSRDTDGTWRIKAGAKVRVKLTMVAESQRTHVALIDPLPAGLEALNPTLAVTQPVADDQGQASSKRGWWWGNWYEFQQFRDDRSEAFTTYLPGGVYDYSYVARATTPGSFIVPPSRAEEMYAPETFGRTSTDRVIVG